jgi:hypothetical protein
LCLNPREALAARQVNKALNDCCRVAKVLHYS